MHTEDIEHLAKLARIELTAEEVARYQKEIGDILGYITHINEAAGDAPAVIESASVRNVLRDDTAPDTPETHTAALLAQAPATRDGFIEVQKILDTTHGA